MGLFGLRVTSVFKKCDTVVNCFQNGKCWKEVYGLWNSVKGKGTPREKVKKIKDWIPLRSLTVSLDAYCS